MTMLGLACHQGLGEHGKWDWEGLACFVLFCLFVRLLVSVNALFSKLNTTHNGEIAFLLYLIFYKL